MTLIHDEKLVTKTQEISKVRWYLQFMKTKEWSKINAVELITCPVGDGELDKTTV